MNEVTIIPEHILKKVAECKKLLDAGYNVMYIPTRRAGTGLMQQLLQTEDIAHEETDNQAAGREDTP